MEKILILADSTCDVPKELIELYNICIVPLTVSFGDEEYKDYFELTSEEFYEKLSTSDIMPTTSLVNPETFVEVYKTKLDQYQSIISLHLSSSTSGTCQSAITAKNILDTDRIDVIDTKGLSLGFGSMVIEAARMVEAGKSREEILDRINYMKERIEHIFVVDTLEYLKRGGRLSAAKATIGTMLNLKPLLNVVDGKIETFDKVRGTKKVIPKMLEVMEQRGGNISEQIVGIAHAVIPDIAEDMKERIQERFNPKEIIISNVGSVIGTHAGPGVLGLFFLSK